MIGVMAGNLYEVADDYAIDRLSSIHGMLGGNCSSCAD
jgi:hypothetical protein